MCEAGFLSDVVVHKPFGIHREENNPQFKAARQVRGGADIYVPTQLWPHQCL